jgi:sigma-E factor negative regulatory protein RseC
MAHLNGLVVSIEKNGWAKVVTEKKSACSSCGASHSCHSSLSGSKTVTKVLNTANAREGDLVSINLSMGKVLKNAALIYLIPIAGLLSGAILGAGLNVKLAISETSAAILFSLVGLCLGFCITILISRFMSAKNRNAPIITHIIKQGREPSPSSLSIYQNYNMKACPECD